MNTKQEGYNPLGPSAPPGGQGPQGYPPQPGYPPQGYPQPGYPPQGYPQQGYPPQGYPPQQPQGHVPQQPPPAQGYTPQSPAQSMPQVMTDQETDDWAGSSFSEKAIRMVFIRKVYAIVIIQLLFTTGVTLFFCYHEPTKRWVQAHRWLYYVSYAVFLVIYITLVCFSSFRRKWPRNVICLVIFTLALTFMTAMISSAHDTRAVLVALGITVGVSVAVSLFACQTKWDFTKCGGVCLVMIVVLVMSGIILGIWYFFMKDKEDMKILHAVFGCIGGLLASIAVFLPAGYPDSVSDDYTTYQIWDTIQAFASAITSSFATQSVLKGYGVGDQQASLVAATVTWLMKDGLGKVGRILFAWYQGTHLDCDCKKWRFFADILYDISIFLQILASVYKSAFFILICTSGVFVAIVGVAGSATRAALTQHQARRNNLADVSAKDGSQETMVNMMGLLVSIVLAPLVSQNTNLAWVIFVLLTAVHVYANWRSMKALNMETLNQARFHLVAQSYFSSPSGLIMSIFDANQREPVFGRLKRELKIFLGYSLGKVVKSYAELNNLTGLYSGERYLLNINAKKRQVYIILHEEATVVDELVAMLQAELLEYCFRASHGFTSSNPPQLQHVMDAVSKGDERAMVVHSRKVTSSLFPAFFSGLKNAGWTTAHALLNADEWRARWPLTKPV